MIGHDPDASAVVRRTELPVVLLPGMNLLGFARQHIVQQFSFPGLATLGISGVGILVKFFFFRQIRLIFFHLFSFMKNLWCQK